MASSELTLPPTDGLWPVPRWVRALAVIVGVVTVATAGPLAVTAGLLPRLRPGEPPQLAFMGFELVATVAGLLLIIFGLGRFRVGPAMALVCLAGTILAASALGWQAASRNLVGRSLTPLLGVRAGTSLVVLAAAAWLVLSRDRRALLVFAKGLITTLAALAITGAFLYGPTRAMIQRVMDLHTMVAFAVAIFSFLIVCVLLAIGGHLIIRAFELGRLEDKPRPRPAAPPATPPAAS